MHLNWLKSKIMLQTYLFNHIIALWCPVAGDKAGRQGSRFHVLLSFPHIFKNISISVWK